MKFLKTRTHGILDYLVGVLLIISPWLFGFAIGGAAQVIPMIVGILILVMAIFTDYEYGVVKSIPMSFHLTMDIIAGIFLAVSPWLFGFASYIFWPHLIFGLFEIGTALSTYRVPDYKTIMH